MRAEYNIFRLALKLSAVMIRRVILLPWVSPQNFC